MILQQGAAVGTVAEQVQWSWSTSPAEGNRLYAIIGWRTTVINSDLVNLPAGWQIEAFDFFETDVANRRGLAVISKLAGASEPLSVTITTSPVDGSAVMVASYFEVDGDLRVVNVDTNHSAADTVTQLIVPTINPGSILPTAGIALFGVVLRENQTFSWALDNENVSSQSGATSVSMTWRSIPDINGDHNNTVTFSGGSMPVGVSLLLSPQSWIEPTLIQLGSVNEYTDPIPEEGDLVRYRARANFDGLQSDYSEPKAIAREDTVALGIFGVEENTEPAFEGSRASSAAFALVDETLVNPIGLIAVSGAFELDEDTSLTFIGSTSKFASFELDDLTSVTWTGGAPIKGSFLIEENTGVTANGSIDPISTFGVNDTATISLDGFTLKGGAFGIPESSLVELFGTTEGSATFAIVEDTQLELIGFTTAEAVFGLSDNTLISFFGLILERDITISFAEPTKYEIEFIFVSSGLSIKSPETNWDMKEATQRWSIKDAVIDRS